jgi:hypothetical protein
MSRALEVVERADLVATGTHIIHDRSFDGLPPHPGLSLHLTTLSILHTMGRPLCLVVGKCGDRSSGRGVQGAQLRLFGMSFVFTALTQLTRSTLNMLSNGLSTLPMPRHAFRSFENG